MEKRRRSPFLCAVSRPSQISILYFKTCAGGSDPLIQRSARVSPSRNSIARESILS